jgi:hypothetical protein
MQFLDNGPFNAVKAAYRKELKKYNSLNDARPVDKINFVRAYSRARVDGLTENNILSAFRTTGNWPISRRKELSHPEIQQNVENITPERGLASVVEHDLDATSKNSRQVRDYGKSISLIT